MPDVIQLLPDSIANQIAAGEVIQRPASVVKELLENAVDAGATDIQLVVKDAGKTLIRVIDNGCGMSETDARMSLERHATSKIRNVDDLFHLHTMGFRGEALASIASIAQIELKSRIKGNGLGTQLIVEGSEVRQQEPCTSPNGTSIAVKNLFFNVPARRKFLKRESVELRHIIDEFERVAIPHPEIRMEFTHNDNEVFHLEKGSFRQRIVSVFGKRYNEKLVPVDEETDLIRISGFVVKPEAAKKTRGEQFFFVNDRFIKSPYLHHAITDALKELVPDKAHPGYFLRLEVEPSFIDVNIHPTKTEIKFEDERTIYAILRSATRKAIGKFNVTPSLDFEQETGFDTPVQPQGPIGIPQVTINPEYNPFQEEENSSTRNQAPRQLTPQERSNQENWEKLYETQPEIAQTLQARFESETDENPEEAGTESTEAEPSTPARVAFQLHGKYILAQIKSGMVVIHQSRAHERILYETYLAALESHSTPSQQQLFPQTVKFSAQDAALVNELLPELQRAGVDINEFGQHSFVVQGLPMYAPNTDPQALLEGVLEQYKNSLQELQLPKQEAFARSLARKTAIKPDHRLQSDEMIALIDELFACKNPYTAPSGKPIIHTFTLSDLDKQFE